jgi:phosphatidylserine/phosphatidylglycerophosphate/cardiolipin synthase-like enzyme
MIIGSCNRVCTCSDFFADTISHAAKFAKRIMEIARGILLAPVIGAISLHEGSKLFLHKLSYAKTGGDLATCKQKVIAKNPHILETQEEYYAWKMALIASAKHSIEISNYCGGKPFQEALALISKKIEENPHFRARILTNSYTVNPEEKKIVDAMTEKYPENFEVIIIPVGCFTWGPKLQRHENHTKMVIADQKYCVMGGSTLTNLILPHGTVKAAGGKMSGIADGLCDLDIAAEGQIAESMKLQFDQLWLKWKRLQNIAQNKTLDTGHEFTNHQERVTLSQFAEKKICDEMPCTLLLSQPEQGKENISLKKYLKHIDKAQSAIVVAHVSFNEKKILRALERAIRRGVKVEVITSGHGDLAAQASNICSTKNRLHYHRLMEAASESNGSFRVYEYQAKEVLFHPKTMIFDGKTALLGSVNITRESLKCDDESLLITKSNEVAAKLLNACQKFKEESKEVTKKDMQSGSFTWSLIKGRLLDLVFKNLCD